MPVRVVGWIDPLSQQVDFGLQALRYHSRFEPADHAKKMRVRMLLKKRSVHDGWDPELHVGLGKIETLRHDADNGIRLTIQHDRLAENIRAQAELIPPNRVAQDNYVFFAGFAFRLEEDAA